MCSATKLIKKNIYIYIFLISFFNCFHANLFHMRNFSRLKRGVLTLVGEIGKALQKWQLLLLLLLLILQCVDLDLPVLLRPNCCRFADPSQLIAGFCLLHKFNNNNWYPFCWIISQFFSYNIKFHRTKSKQRCWSSLWHYWQLFQTLRWTSPYVGWIVGSSVFFMSTSSSIHLPSTNKQQTQIYFIAVVSLTVLLY